MLSFLKNLRASRFVALLAAFLLAATCFSLAACDFSISIDDGDQGYSDSSSISQDNGSSNSSSSSSSSGSSSNSNSGSSSSSKQDSSADKPSASKSIDENGTYTSKDEVALYIHTYGHLPSNYITKDEAEAAGWKSTSNDLSKVCPGKSIGGDYFGNYEGLLPKAKGRKYTECDIDYVSGSRNGKRIVFSNDGLIFYTSDHYESYTQLY